MTKLCYLTTSVLLGFAQEVYYWMNSGRSLLSKIFDSETNWLARGRSIVMVDIWKCVKMKRKFGRHFGIEQYGWIWLVRHLVTLDHTECAPEGPRVQTCLTHSAVSSNKQSKIIVWTLHPGKFYTFGANSDLYPSRKCCYACQIQPHRLKHRLGKRSVCFFKCTTSFFWNIVDANISVNCKYGFRVRNLHFIPVKYIWNNLWTFVAKCTILRDIWKFYVH